MRIVLQRRLKKFRDDFETDGNNNFICLSCNQAIKYERKDNIQSHLETTSHKERKIKKTRNVIIYKYFDSEDDYKPMKTFDPKIPEIESEIDMDLVKF